MKERLKERLARFAKGRFTANYTFIYLFCILCIAYVGGTLLNLAAVDDPAESYGLLFGRPSYGPSEGFGRRWFWMMATALPLSVYAVFARTLPFRRSLLVAFACACLSAVPVLVYVTIVRTNMNQFAPLGWSNYFFAIVSLICYVHIVVSLIIRTLLEKYNRTHRAI